MSDKATLVGRSILYPNALVAEPWLPTAPEGLNGKSGSTEPWTQQLLYNLILALRPKLVVEAGAYLGHTTAWFADALERCGGGTLHAIEHDPIRMMMAQKFVDRLETKKVMYAWHCQDACAAISEFPPKTIQFAWVDDDHDPDHVALEFELLIPRMATNGVIAFHDVYGEFNLSGVVEARGGFCLNLPEMHKGWGIGLWQAG